MFKSSPIVENIILASTFCLINYTQAVSSAWPGPAGDWVWEPAGSGSSLKIASPSRAELKLLLLNI